MSKFRVEVKEVHVTVYEFEATDAVDARRIAEYIVETGELEDGTNMPEDNQYYLETMEPDEWVITPITQ